MPHDANGVELKVWDLVRIPAVVTSVYTTDDYCNVSLVTFIPLPPDNTDSFITLNTRQVFKEE